jgi:iron-sulfur cluster repair protein YtfE (RIC family)
MKNEISIGEIVTMDFRAASIFKEAGIDFCCGGRMTIEEACEDKGLDRNEVQRKLDALEFAPADTVHNFKEWDLGFLCDYIVNTHHKFVLKSLPELVHYTEKIANVHGAGHPELLKNHIAKENNILFRMADNALSEAVHRELLTQFRQAERGHSSGSSSEDHIRMIENLASYYGV